jgi:hypothetical protein
MPSLADLFSGTNFQNTIRNYCSQIGWKIRDLNNRRAVLGFNMDSGRTQTLYIIRYESTLEFSVPSMAQFDTTDDVPHYLSTLLLKRSSERKIGFWCIEEIGGKQTYSHMHNAEMQLIDVNYFAKVIRALIRECDDFEGLLAKR